MAATPPAFETPSARSRRLEVRSPERLREGLEGSLDLLVGRWRARGAVRLKLQNVAEQIHRRAAELETLSERQLRLRLEELREAWPTGDGAISEEAKHEALAVVSTAAWRTLGQRPYPEQILGALVLGDGALAEMATGEGKTLTLVLAAVLLAWRRRPCHLLTANDYLAERDARGMEVLYTFCGVKVASVTGGLSGEVRAARYRADVVYTTSRELVADYLRDRLRTGRRSAASQALIRSAFGARLRGPETTLRGIHSVLLDEADHLLIDEAVTPLIISAPRRDRAREEAAREAFRWSADFVRDADYSIDTARREVTLLAAGRRRLESAFSTAQPLLAAKRWREEWVCQALKARELFHRGRHYAVEDGRVVIIDEGTGRFMPMRSWGQGLHQMVELKEGLALTPPTVTVASLSFQRFFRQVPALAGVTGTARENAAELWRIYRLCVWPIPTHRPSRRAVNPLRVEANADTRWKLAADQIADLHAAGRPVLVGTRSVEASEALSSELSRRDLAHQLLNAVEHRHEAKVIARAGLPGTITVATNMAGRGADIRLSTEVVERGGLVVLATELHESERVDRQLFGRCARQGDPGTVICFASWDDELIRRFLPRWLRSVGRAWQSHCLPGYSVIARWCFRWAQRSASRRAVRARLQVLRHDRWLDESFG